MTKKYAEYNNCDSIVNALIKADSFIFWAFGSASLDYYYTIDGLTITVIID